MKRLVIFLGLGLASIINSFGQWYVKDYGVTDPSLLTGYQLEEAISDSKTKLMHSGIVAGLGGLLYFGLKYLPFEPDEDPTLIEQLIGEKGMQKIGMGLGAGLFAGGVVAGVVYLGRIARIKSVLNRKYQIPGSVSLTPVVIPGNSNSSLSAGLTITVTF
ncbi:MAG: hypothetical protein MUE74_02990 [Bacteroidales bacterium]|jgi:hypothetical protein|nr:hypothetical protein [Bacteroidales bacterium]